MPFDSNLALRLVEAMPNIPGLTETRMMGGFGYLLHGNMCVGIHKDTLIIRVGVETAEQVLQESHVRPMDLTGKVMKGWATVEPEAMKTPEDLKRYCLLAVDFVSTLPKK